MDILTFIIAMTSIIGGIWGFVALVKAFFSYRQARKEGVNVTLNEIESMFKAVLLDVVMPLQQRIDDFERARGTLEDDKPKLLSIEMTEPDETPAE